MRRELFILTIKLKPVALVLLGNRKLRFFLVAAEMIGRAVQAKIVPLIPPIIDLSIWPSGCSVSPRHHLLTFPSTTRR
jgi:hypothetical protein